MATTRISSPQFLAAALIIFSLLFIAETSSANSVPQASPKPVGRPKIPPPTTTAKNATVDPKKKSRTANMIKEFLDAHNKVRASFGHSPLQWNYTLANIAKQWALKRAADCRMIHSSVYGYGENIFWAGRLHWTPTDVVQDWVGEKAYYEPKTNSCAKGQTCGHYTQVIWKDTVGLGCYRVNCLKDGGMYVVCTYYPPGNIQNEGPFGSSIDVNLNKNSKLPLAKLSLSLKPFKLVG